MKYNEFKELCEQLFNLNRKKIIKNMHVSLCTYLYLCANTEHSETLHTLSSIAFALGFTVSKNSVMRVNELLEFLKTLKIINIETVKDLHKITLNKLTAAQTKRIISNLSNEEKKKKTTDTVKCVLDIVNKYFPESSLPKKWDAVQLKIVTSVYAKTDFECYVQWFVRCKLGKKRGEQLWRLFTANALIDEFKTLQSNFANVKRIKDTGKGKKIYANSDDVLDKVISDIEDVNV